MGLQHCLTCLGQLFPGIQPLMMTNCFEGIVDDNAKKPGSKRPLLIKLPNPFIQAQKSRLHDLSRYPLIMDDEKGSPYCPHLVMLNQPGQTLNITLSQASYRLCFSHSTPL
jgi:hypothetical protein